MPVIHKIKELLTELNLAVNEDSRFSYIYTEGEITSVRILPGKGMFFDIKDEESSLSCQMWGNNLSQLTFKPEVGKRVTCFGSFTIYKNRGQLKFTVYNMQESGIGEKLLALKLLKEKLEKEGLFSEEHKLSLPSFPRKIGLITGKDSAAESDFIKNLFNHYKLAELDIFYSLMQGKEAENDLIRAFTFADNLNLDVIVISRGGGSKDDLDTFNSEKLARVIAKRKTPVVSAVGHEIDFSILDLVSDQRVSTPTAAANLIAPDQGELLLGLEERRAEVQKSVLRKITDLEMKLQLIKNKKFFSSPNAMYEMKKEKLMNLKVRLESSFERYLLNQERIFNEMKSTLINLNPLKILSRGYSVTYTEEGKIVKDIKDVKAGVTIKSQVKNGIITSQVREIKDGKERA